MNNVEKTLKLIEDSLNKKCNGLECKVVKNNIDLRLENIQLKKQIDLMALAILNYDDQLVINRYKDIDEVKETFEELAKEEGE